MPDQRGFGASEGDSRDLYKEEVSASDFLAVMDAAKAQRAVMVGWSALAPIAIRFAVMHPERVDALILINTFAHYVRQDDYPWGYPPEQLDDVVTFLESSWGSAAELKMTAPSRMADEYLQALWGRSRRSGIPPRRYAEGFRLGIESDVRALLPAISCPTLVLHREGDRVIHLGAGRYLAEHIPGAKFVVLSGDDHLYFVGDTDALVDEIEEFLTGSRGGTETSVVGVTVLFTDIAGSTEQEVRLGPREWSRLTDAYEAMLHDVLARHRGREVRTTGDGVLATFDANGRAVRCAIEIVARAKGMGLDLRAGIHTGDVELRGDDIGGLQVNIARRVCDLAAPGEVWVSETVKSATTGSGFGFKEQGQHELKGVPGSWRIYGVME
jgi:class 3 adenylate cyclase